MHICYNLYVTHVHHMHFFCHISLNLAHTFIQIYMCTHACRETKGRMIRCPFLLTELQQFAREIIPIVFLVWVAEAIKAK